MTDRSRLDHCVWTGIRGSLSACSGGLVAAATLLLTVFCWQTASAQDGGNRTENADQYFRQVQFRRGDFNIDGNVDVSDALGIFNYLFLGGAGTPCENAADSNKDVSIDLTDGVHILGYLFMGGAPPASPGPVECGVETSASSLPCESYALCGSDLPLITHVLNRITFGATEELLTRIQTRGDLLEYIDEQLSFPGNYAQAVDEPELRELITQLEIGSVPEGRFRNQIIERLKAMLILDAAYSRWQLLHKLTVFWNNHFHTEVGTLQQNFFSRGGRGGTSNRATEELFTAMDSDGSEFIDEAEWNTVQQDHPGLAPWGVFNRITADGQVTLEEFIDQRNIAWWKYARVQDQRAVSAAMEQREYDYFRRNAFGNFADLLEGSAKSVAQVIYLNNYENVVSAPNENYAREYLELFSLGVDHVYTQRDIEELAKVFTGWNAGWQLRSLYDANDVLFIGNPGGQNFPLNTRENGGDVFNFPDLRYWSDEDYTWAFHFGNPGRPRRGQPPPSEDGHDWARKDLFLPLYGGVDSLGNPVSPLLSVQIPANDTDQTAATAMSEFDNVLEVTVSLRDCAKFISTKLIQLLVTDDITALSKTYGMPEDLQDIFDSVDLDGNGRLDAGEWSEPTPDLPNGRPPAILATLDADADGLVTSLEYQEPDMLLDAIAAWQTSGGEIRQVLRSILFSDEFLSLKFYRAKIKDPFESVVSTLRALDVDVVSQDLVGMVGDIETAGMEQFEFSDPTGESELGFDWLHTVGLLERFKFVNRVANPPTPRDSRGSWNPRNLINRWRLTNDDSVVNYFNLLLFGGDLLLPHQTLSKASYGNGNNPENRMRYAVSYLLSLPPFQKQ